MRNQETNVTIEAAVMDKELKKGNTENSLEIQKADV